MSKKIVINIVVVLSILIVFSFIALIYGIYIKISDKSKYIKDSPNLISLQLNEGDEIVDIEVIDNKKLLLIIKNSSQLKGAIYNIDQGRIVEIIDK